MRNSKLLKAASYVVLYCVTSEMHTLSPTENSYPKTFFSILLFFFLPSLFRILCFVFCFSISFFFFFKHEFVYFSFYLKKKKKKWWTGFLNRKSNDSVHNPRRSHQRAPGISGFEKKKTKITSTQLFSMSLIINTFNKSSRLTTSNTLIFHTHTHSGGLRNVVT